MTAAPTEKATTQKATEKPAPATTAAKATEKPAPATTPAKATEKQTTKSGKTLKPSKPSSIDCDKDHTVTVKDDKNLNGVLVVKSCHATRFDRKPTRCTNVGNQLGSLVNARLAKLGVKDKFDVKIVKTAGDKTQTEFHYTVPCDKSRHQTVIDSLKDACKDKALTDTCTHENQPDDDDSSSESDEVTTKGAPAKVTQQDARPSTTTAAKATDKPAPATAPAKVTQKQTTKSGGTLKPSKPSSVDCDKDHTVTVKDDNNLNGVLVVKSCHATRFDRKPTRCTNVGNQLGSLVNARLAKLGVKDKFDVKIVKTAGDKTQTEFHYTVPCDKSRHQTVIDSLKDACKDKALTDTCTHENQPDEDDSSSESDEATTKGAPAKVTQQDARPSTTTAAPAKTPATTPAKATQKQTTKSGKTLKPSKPSSVDCDKDHTVTVKDDNNLNGVLVVKSCHATRFDRKPTRCTNVGNQLGSLVNARLAKLGVKDKFDVKIVKTAGDKTQTEFHYTVPCDKSRQQTVIDSLKDACKDKALTDTCTHENQPDEDDSSSESDEVTTKGAPAKVTQQDARSSTTTAPAKTPAKATQKQTTKSGRTLKPSKPSSVDCDKDHTVTVKDDKNLNGVLVVKSCHATRFDRKPTRCTNVGNQLGSLVNARLAKLGVKDKFDVKIVKTAGDKTQN